MIFFPLCENRKTLRPTFSCCFRWQQGEKNLIDCVNLCFLAGTRSKEDDQNCDTHIQLYIQCAGVPLAFPLWFNWLHSSHSQSDGGATGIIGGGKKKSQKPHPGISLYWKRNV